MIICTNCKTEYKEKELEEYADKAAENKNKDVDECPKCKTKTLKYKDNKTALFAFIISLFLPFAWAILEIYSIVSPSIESILSIIIMTLVIISVAFQPISFLAAIAALLTSKLYFNKYKILSIAAILISSITMILFFNRIANSVSDSCGGNWCGELNTTIQMNWQHPDQEYY